jgi:4-hydroxy-3-methylbut-2-enyl diphosphate reductase
VIVEIDQKSGFCFGVSNAIRHAEEALKSTGKLFSLGHIVHNEQEVNRLKEIGLEVISHEFFFQLKDCTVLIRAHGEPPSTYQYAEANNIRLIDGTCPVVLKLQQRVKSAAELLKAQSGQVIIFGNQGHAEVTGLAGQVGDSAVIVDHPDDLERIDFDRPKIIFSQTTKSVSDFRQFTENVRQKAGKGMTEYHDTICRQVSNRVPDLEQFASRFDLIIFVGGVESSNAKFLFGICKKANSHSYFISSPEELEIQWFSGIGSVGICGATSTPQWLMKQVAACIPNL